MKLLLAAAFLSAASAVTTTVVENNFNSNNNGWNYLDNTHFGTTEETYASGNYANGKLEITVGGVNGVDITTGMSGGWEYVFTTSELGSVTITFDYELAISTAYEDDEFGEVVVELDGHEKVVRRLTGTYGTYATSGAGESIFFDWVEPGTHTVTLGAHNNQKTTSSEYSVVKYDYVKVETEPISETCPYYVLDFDGPLRGEYVTDEWHSSFGVTLACAADNSDHDGRCRVFDSANPQGHWTNADAIRVGGTSSSCTGSTTSQSCGDPDLGAPNNKCSPAGPGHSNDGSGGPLDEYPNCEPQGNIVVIDEGGPNKAPDDTGGGGTITFTFDYPVTLWKICYIDLDGAEHSHIDVHYADGTSVTDIDTIVAGDNGYACTDLSSHTNVEEMVFRMDGSGSVSDVYYFKCDPTTTTTTTSTTTTTTTSTTTTTTTTPATTTTTTAATEAATTPAAAETTTTTTPATEPEFTEGDTPGGGGGDPHFQRWGQAHSSFHGECDLVMVHSEEFHNGAGLDLHVRTTIEGYFSYIETAALRVGDNILQFYNDHLFLNSVQLTPADLPFTFGGDFKYTISNKAVEEGKNPKFYQYYKVDLHEDSAIVFKFYKQYLTISIKGHNTDFADSVGLLGDYHTGDMISRDGNLMTDFKAYGFEWQVNPEDPKLFTELRAPQLPFEMCRMPTGARPSRRALRGRDSALAEQAASACARVKGSDYDLCVDDILTTGDVGLADLW